MRKTNRFVSARTVSSAVALATLLGTGMTTGFSTSAGASSGTVSYGVLSCFTGPLASLGEGIYQGAQIAQAQVNAAGGVLGKKLSIPQGDTGCDPVEGKTALLKLLSGGGIAGIIGPTTQEINAVEPVLKANKIIDEFQGGDTGRDHQTDPYLFRDSPSDSQLGVAMATYAHIKGYKRADLLFYSDAAAQTIVAPVRSTFIKLGGTVVHTYIITADQSSYTNTVAQVISDKPQVIFSQTDAPTVAVLSTEFSQLGSKIPWIGTDVTTSSDYIKAFGTARAHSTLTSVMGTSVTGTANNVFMAGFKKMFPSQAAAGPLSGANYAYDAVISLALADTYAKTFNGTTVAADMTKVTNPPGTACYSYASCVNLLKAHKKINYEGASGSIDYNKFHNTFGPYAPFIANASTGNEVQGTALSAKVLGDVTNCTTTASCLAVLRADGIK
ncbi:MAG: ABC transporter substrate-binding protein [Acidobacteriota bacterium]|nr:ABC transporter substrate-binding protein [Acidobacteriota bacterium]MDE3031736.1 ABC transporter substrate-binding protein [Acidobacteriota bacterium]MDE3092481.1 ABC transporter substrate-binding protein [Acidobacteriota bacterium]MDE3138483.1 ABC transporter substrate-binding protein [Acidobacteriota bacterium]MDE3146284.1 ABC transporter substrate-binding protein [Acidobacteriota bacterium]